MEIERKYLLEKPPFDLSAFRRLEIEQAYISVDPVIRLRRSGAQYFLTVKQGGAIAHEEAEFLLTEEQYKKLWKKTETKSLYKTRYLIPLDGGLTAELDVYGGDLLGLLTVEVEFETLQAAQDFTPPSWFGKDVSENHAYKNSYLVIYGKPLT